MSYLENLLNMTEIFGINEVVEKVHPSFITSSYNLFIKTIIVKNHMKTITVFNFMFF